MEIEISTSDPDAVDPVRVARCLEKENWFVRSVSVNDGERRWTHPMLVREYGWEPEVGQRVMYQPHRDLVPEYGVVLEIRGQNAMVLYHGDLTAKSTRIVDLEPVEARDE